MPQVSLYIDKETHEKIEKMAQQSHTSLSKWVGDNLKRLIKDDYPDTFFGLFGMMQDDSFERPEELSFDNDSERVTI
jgi:hypothetical protein